MSAEHLTAEEHALQIDAHDAIELVFGDVEKRRRRVDARAVDDDVDAAGALKDGAEQRFDLGLAGGFRRVKPCAAAGRLDLAEPRVGLLFVSADEDDLGARARKTFGHRAAQLAGAADDDGDLLVQGKERGQEVRRVCATHKSGILPSHPAVDKTQVAGITRTESPNSCGRYPWAASSSSAADNVRSSANARSSS